MTPLRVELLVPGLGNLYQHLSPYSYSFMRFCTGAVLVPHGAQKTLYVPVTQFAGNIAAQGFPAPAATGLPHLLHRTGCGRMSGSRSGHAARRDHDLDRDGGHHHELYWRYGYFWTNRGIEYALLSLLLCTAIFFRVEAAIRSIG